MAFNVNQFAGQLKGGGARNALFQVFINNPVNPVADIQVPFMCKAAQIPAATIGAIDVPYFGRVVRIAGNRPAFEDWTPTIINDEDFAIRNAMEEWHQSINQFAGNSRAFGTSAPSEYKSTARVQQFDQLGAVIREYEFVGIFPTNVAAIDLAWETEGIEEFQVTFAYDYWQISGGSTGDAGGSGSSVSFSVNL
jgi:hypothetical protein